MFYCFFSRNVASMSRLAFLFFACGILSNSSCSLSTSSSANIKHVRTPPIVYTIAGSDSGGGAGIQADLHAIHAMKCHGCSAITCLTAQNSVGVTAVHYPPASFLKTQLETLADDLHPTAVKIGMLGNDELARTVGEFVQNLKERQERKLWVVLDPVMISTSGHKLIDDKAVNAMIDHIFPYADVVTPNKFEAEALLRRKLNTPRDVEEGARDLLKMGCKSVLIKGGHTFTDTSTADDVTIHYAQDFLLSSEAPVTDGNQRLCDSPLGVWLRTPRYVTCHMN